MTCDVRTFWNPIIETMAPERLKDLQLKKFKRILAWGYENSRLYRRLYDQTGLRPRDVKTWDDVRKVPLLEKDHYRDAQAKDPWPYGDSLCVPLEKVTVYHQTTGTTGQPVYQPDTWQDWEWWAECWSYILWAQGFRSSDRVYIPFGYNVFVAYWAGHYACEKVGCEVVSGAMLNTEERLLKMQELKVTAFMATPTYVLGMADSCRKKLATDPRSLGIKRILCAGEPGASVPSTKKRMEEAWGADVFDHAGATEIGGWSFECSHKPGGIHVNEGMFLVELLDIETGELVEEAGKLGRIVITAFDRLAQPCIRFDSKDLGMWGDQCSCGRTFRVLKGGVRGRTDHITKVKGVLFSPVSVEEVVRGTNELGDEFMLTVEREGDTDRITLEVEINCGCEHREDEIRADLARQLKLKTNLNYIIHCVPFGSLQRFEVKARRFKDMRKAGGEKV
ncbi:MAG: phenylacetate--CoA ligase family protein [Desulfocucumaceae bacterium]